MEHEDDAIEAGRDKGLDFPLKKREAIANMEKLNAPLKEKEWNRLGMLFPIKDWVWTNLSFEIEIEQTCLKVVFKRILI